MQAQYNLTTMTFDDGLSLVKEAQEKQAIGMDDIKQWWQQLRSGASDKLTQALQTEAGQKLQELWANKNIRYPALGAIAGGGAGLLSSVAQPKGRRRPISRGLTGALIGGLGGFGAAQAEPFLEGTPGKVDVEAAQRAQEAWEGKAPPPKLLDPKEHFVGDKDTQEPNLAQKGTRAALQAIGIEPPKELSTEEPNWAHENPGQASAAATVGGGLAGRALGGAINRRAQMSQARSAPQGDLPGQLRSNLGQTQQFDIDAELSRQQLPWRPFSRRPARYRAAREFVKTRPGARGARTGGMLGGALLGYGGEEAYQMLTNPAARNLEAAKEMARVEGTLDSYYNTDEYSPPTGDQAAYDAYNMNIASAGNEEAFNTGSTELSDYDALNTITQGADDPRELQRVLSYAVDEYPPLANNPAVQRILGGGVAREAPAAAPAPAPAAPAGPALQPIPTPSRPSAPQRGPELGEDIKRRYSDIFGNLVDQASQLNPFN